MHSWRERVWASHLVRRSAVKRRLSHLYRTVLLGLCLPLANYPVSFSTPDLPWYTLLWVHAPLSQDGYQREGFWEEQDSLWSGIIPWLLTHKEPFCACVVSPLGESGWEHKFWIQMHLGWNPSFLCLCVVSFTFLICKMRNLLKVCPSLSLPWLTLRCL